MFSTQFYQHFSVRWGFLIHSRAPWHQPLRWHFPDILRSVLSHGDEHLYQVYVDWFGRQLYKYFPAWINLYYIVNKLVELVGHNTAYFIAMILVIVTRVVEYKLFVAACATAWSFYLVYSYNVKCQSFHFFIVLVELSGYKESSCIQTS